MYAVQLTKVSLNFKQHGRAFLIVATVIFVCCLLGIFTRPIAYFAYFWPANAVLIGLFLRFKRLRNVGGWLGAFIGYMSADLVTGSHLELTLALTIANFMTVGVSLFFIHYFSVHDKFHRTLILSGFCLLKIAKISLNSSFFPKPIKR